MTTLELAVDSFLASAAGPVLCEELCAGMELVVVGRDGQFRTDLVQEVVPVGRREVAQVLTPVGDIKVPLASALITRRGLERPVDLVGGDAITARVELVRPLDLPRRQAQWRLTKADVLAVLQALDPPVVMIPANRPDIDDVVAMISRYLDLAGVHYEIGKSGRWTTFVFERVQGLWVADLRAQAEVLMSLTTWIADGGSMRVRMSDDRLRRRVLAALVATGGAPAVKWVPAYRPAECHISELSEHKAWQPFAPVQSIRVREERVVRVRFSEVGHVVCGLGIVGSFA